MRDIRKGAETDSPKHLDRKTDGIIACSTTKIGYISDNPLKIKRIRPIFINQGKTARTSSASPMGQKYGRARR